MARFRYDYPAAIDYILEATKQEDLFYVGYSMGATHYFMLLSELPEYNAKIKAGFVMGPAVFIGNRFLRMGKPFYEYMMSALDWLGMNELFSKSLADLNHYTCTKDNNHAKYCHLIWNLVANTDKEEIDLKTSLTQMTNMPSGKNMKKDCFALYTQCPRT